MCQKKIQYLCSKINHLEWSGVLLYKVIDPILYKLEAVDLYPVDKGTAGHTAFEYPTGLYEYMINNGLLDCKQGLIHSHNNMAVFFSAEDNSELQDNSPNHALYLSLIVNNRNEMCAKLTQYSKVSYNNIISKARDFNGNEIEIPCSDYTEEQIFVYNCDIIKPEELALFNEDWFDLATEVIDRSNPIIQTKYIGTGTQSNMFPSGAYNKSGKSKSKPVTHQFVNEWILNGKAGQSLPQAAKDYKYSSIYDGSIIVAYETVYDTLLNTHKEESKVYAEILHILNPYIYYPQISTLINAIKTLNYEWTT